MERVSRTERAGGGGQSARAVVLASSMMLLALVAALLLSSNADPNALVESSEDLVSSPTDALYRREARRTLPNAVRFIPKLCRTMQQARPGEARLEGAIIYK